MSNNRKDHLEVTYDQVAGFLEISKKKEMHSKELLKYVLKNDVPCTDEAINHMCELFSASGAISKYLKKFIEMENVTEKTIFKMNPNDVLTMSTLMVNLIAICDSLKKYNYSLEVH